MTFIDQLIQIDGNLLIGIQHSLNADWLTPIMKGVSFFGNIGWASILLCIVLICFKKTRRLGVLCAGSVLLTFICCTGIIKPMVDRPRPWELFSAVQPLIPDPGDSSFPSGHASNSMAVAFAFWLNTRKSNTVSLEEDRCRLHRWSYVAIVFALMIALSRLYLGMHFPSDVIGGILIAIICSQIIYLINIKIESKRGIISG